MRKEICPSRNLVAFGSLMIIPNSIRWFLLLGVLVLALTPRLVQAEEPMRLKELQVSVWPEYDDPRVLVMYIGEVAPGTALPREIRFRIPPKVAVNSACAILPDGKHSNEVYNLKEEEGYAILSYKLTQPKFHMEFYYNPLEGQTDKKFTYSFQTLDPIDKLELEIQQPLKATNFVVDPPAQSTGTDQEGFKYYHYSYTNVAPDRPIDLKVSYTKADPNPSKAKGQSGGASSGSVDSRTMLLVLGGAMAVGLGYLAYTNYTRRRPVAYSRAAARAAARQVAVARRESTASSVSRKEPLGGFCTGCGARLNKDDRFCPSCGKKVRRA